MKMSRAEFQALVLRAARGAKVPLSQAGEFAALLRSLVEADLKALLPVALAALNTDRSPPEVEETANGWSIAGSDPMQSIPAALDFAQSGAVAVHEFDDLMIHWAKFRGFAASPEGLQETPVPDPAKGHVKIEAQQYDALMALAARTYVPATAASRSGAGAGDIDND